MLPGGQHRIVTLTRAQIRNLYTIDKQDEELESPKIGCPGNNQTSIILRTASAAGEGSRLVPFEGDSLSRIGVPSNHLWIKTGAGWQMFHNSLDQLLLSVRPVL
jgi:hypothetical protein